MNQPLSEPTSEPMHPVRKKNLIQMIKVTGGMIDAMRNAIEAGAAQKNETALALKQHPEFMDQQVDDLIERILPFYASMSNEQVIATIVFYQSPAGDVFKSIQLATAPQLAQVLQQWSHDVLVALNGLN